eukprot:Clim_evm5s214 gene=Clim_evmTU5s214
MAQLAPIRQIHTGKCPIYATDLLAGQYLVVAGGGGAAKSGIPNQFEVLRLEMNRAKGAGITGANSLTSVNVGSEAIGCISCNYDLNSNKLTLVCGMDKFVGVFAGFLENNECHLQEMMRKMVVSGDDEDDYIMKVALSKDGNVILAGVSNGDVILLQTESLAQLAVGAGHTKEINDCAVCPVPPLSGRGHELLTGCTDGSAKVWEYGTETGSDTDVLNEVGMFLSDPSWTKAKSYEIKGAAYVIGGNVRANDPKELRKRLGVMTIHSTKQKLPSYACLWSRATNKRVATLKLEQEPITVYGVSSDYKLAAVAYATGDIGFIDVTNFAYLGKISGVHDIFITGMSFDLPNQGILSATIDKNIRYSLLTEIQGSSVTLYFILVLVFIVILTAAVMVMV